MNPNGAETTAAIRTVAIVGAGAMGAMYAAHFADAGFATWLVATGGRAIRLRADPIVINDATLDAAIVDPSAGQTPGHADLVIVAVKHADLREALESVAPLVSERSTFLSVLNGLTSEDVIAERYGPDVVLDCVALAMDAMREGHRVRYRQAGRLVFGVRRDATTGQGERVTAVQQALDRAGLAWQTPPDMRHAMWWKFMINVGINQASALMRAPYSAFQGTGPERSLMWALIDEVVQVARAEGIDLMQADLDAWDAVLADQPPDGWTSMHQDVAAGRPTEVEIFAGHVVELGSRHGIPTPYNQSVLWILRAGRPARP